MLRTTLRRLEVFVTAVEAGGFRACADKLEISQAAVSHQIKQLETELGFLLFVRRRGSVAGVTKRGVGAYRQAKDLLKDADQLAALNNTQSGSGPQQLLVQADPVLDSHLARRIAQYMGSNSGVEVKLRQSCFEDMANSFSTGEAEIAYFYSAGPVSELDSSLAWSEPVCICARGDHPLHDQGPIDLEAACRYPFVAPPKGSHFRRSVDQLFRQRGVAEYPVVFEAGHAHMAREAVINGLAISAVITRYLDEELSRYGVRRIPLRQGDMALQVRRAMRRDLSLDMTVSRLTEFLEAESRRDRLDSREASKTDATPVQPAL